MPNTPTRIDIAAISIDKVQFPRRSPYASEYGDEC